MMYIVREHTPACEWEYYEVSQGNSCERGGSFAIVEKAEELDDTHIGHLCSDHIESVRLTLEESLNTEVKYE